MDALILNALSSLIQRQAEVYCAQAERQAPAHIGYLLKVNGSQLQASVAKHTKRSRDAAHEETTAATPHAVSEAWPTLVLDALLRIVRAAAQEDASADATSRSASATLHRALAALTGLEIRHCRLAATHVFSPGAGDSDCLHSLLFDATLPWNATPPRQVANTGTCAALTLLDLECNQLGDEGVQALCRHVLRCLPSLQRLHLASNGITDVGCTALLSTLTSKQAQVTRSLEVLGLTNNAVGCSAGSGDAASSSVTSDWCSSVSAFALAFAATLRRVHLNHAGLGTNEALVLLRALLVNHQAAGSSAVFDVVYLRENPHVEREVVLRDLAAETASKEEVRRFVERHVSW